MKHRILKISTTLILVLSVFINISIVSASHNTTDTSDEYEVRKDGQSMPNTKYHSFELVKSLATTFGGTIWNVTKNIAGDIGSMFGASGSSGTGFGVAGSGTGTVGTGAGPNQSMSGSNALTQSAEAQGLGASSGGGGATNTFGGLVTSIEDV
jgi:hypothetical protein